jgi:biotin synthase
MKSAAHSSHKSREEAPRKPHNRQCGGRNANWDRRQKPSTAIGRFKLTASLRLPKLRAIPLRCLVMIDSTTRHDWSRSDVLALFALPFNDLLLRAQQTHRAHHAANAVQVSTLLSIKTGGCPEDCAYCPQSARYATSVKAEKLMSVDAVTEKARQAKAAGATRFCMGAAWRSPKDRDVEKVAAMVGAVKALGMETCATLGMLSATQARSLKAAGLDYYNHNLDSAPEFYGEIIQTRDYQDRLDTLENVRSVGMKTCCGGIVGMGETREQRAGLLQTLANLPEHPQSVPINRLVQVEGTPLNGTALLDPFEFVRTIAVARLLMPKSVVRLSAGRAEMNDELQALCFLAGANSIFYGEKLLTTGNPDVAHDQALFARLGIVPMEIDIEPATAHEDIVESAAPAMA